MPDPSTTPETEPAQLPVEGKVQQAELDLEMLAERILQLLKEDARLERERLGPRRRW